MHDTPISVVFVELNEADDHFLQRLLHAGRLPHMARMLEEGARVDTFVPGHDVESPRSWP